MAVPLLGLDSTLADEGCDRVELAVASEDARVVFVRQGQDAWAAEDGHLPPFDTQELQRRIRREFGRTCDRLVCFLPLEEVVYAAEGGAVNVTRQARADTHPDTERPDLEAVARALGIPKSKRKAKFKQARQFASIVELALSKTHSGDLRILDMACGRSYLGFVLVQLLGAGARKVSLHGIDSEPPLVEKSRQIASTLQWTNCTFEVADLEAYSVPPDTYDVALSLHACDTLTDEAIRIACQARTPLIFVSPCCQNELRQKWGKDRPLRWMSRYGLLEERLADVLTDGFRCLVMEAIGYRVKTIRFTDPDVTPKNLLIQARLSTGPTAERAREAAEFLKQFHVRPRLAALLDAGAPR